MGNFRFSEGVEFNGRDDQGHFSLSVSIPTDEEGYIGRECPGCEQHFRVLLDDYDELPDELALWCAYCGEHADHSEFLTQQQRDRVLAPASDLAVQMLDDALGSAFRHSSRSSRKSGFKITYRSKPFYPTPLPGINEERLIRQRECGQCGLRYGVFGEHRWCPVCGPLPAPVVALEALRAEEIRLAALNDLDAGQLGSLRESGVLNRTYADTISSVVATVEVLAETIYRGRVGNAEDRLKKKGRLFQRLNDFADVYAQELGVDLRAPIGDDWEHLLSAWAARHAFTHSGGMVDAKYLAAVPDSPLREGQRIVLKEDYVLATLERTRRLCEAIAHAEAAGSGE